MEKYIKPAISIYNFQQDTNILAGSEQLNVDPNADSNTQLARPYEMWEADDE